MSHLLVQGDAGRLPFRTGSVDLVFGSPPYVDARLYLEDGRDLGIARGCLAWVEWMLAITAEAQRVSRGPVLWVAAGKTKDRNYWPACEGLMWEWWKRGGDCQLYRPCYWHRVGIPGSGGKDWFRADVEYVMCFKRPGELPWSDNTAMGHAPKWAPGGEMSYRLTDGDRRNQWGRHINSTNSSRKSDGSFQPSHRPSHFVPDTKSHTKREPNGDMREQTYTPPVLANPGNLIKSTVGGGQMGSALAHENEAPFPEALVEFFVRSLCPPGGVVLDCFSGSGTTAAVAKRHGRRGIGLDLRRSQCELGVRRLFAVDRPHAPVERPATGEVLPLFAGMERGEVGRG